MRVGVRVQEGVRYYSGTTVHSARTGNKLARRKNNVVEETGVCVCVRGLIIKSLFLALALTIPGKTCRSHLG